MKYSSKDSWLGVSSPNCTPRRLISTEPKEDVFSILKSEMVLDGILSKEKLPSANSIFNLYGRFDRSDYKENERISQDSQ